MVCGGFLLAPAFAASMRTSPLPPNPMPKTTRTYWNPLSPEHGADWQPIEGLEGIAEELTLAIDEQTGDYTRLTRFAPGADTAAFGSKSHDYPEEVFIIEGSLYDAAFDRWLTQGRLREPSARRSARPLPHRRRLPRPRGLVPKPVGPIVVATSLRRPPAAQRASANPRPATQRSHARALRHARCIVNHP